MVNKIISWIIVAITLVIWRFGFEYVGTFAKEGAMQGSIALMVFVAYMMSRKPVPEGDMFTTIVESMKGFLMNHVWLAGAVVVYTAIMAFAHGAFSVQGLVYAAIFSVVATVTSSLTFSAIGAAMKD